MPDVRTALHSNQISISTRRAYKNGFDTRQQRCHHGIVEGTSKRTNTRLQETLDQVSKLGDDDVILARRPWTLESEAEIAALDKDYRVPAAIASRVWTISSNRTSC